MNSHAPVVVFAYNRPEKIKECIQSLERCSECELTDLVVFCDGPKNSSAKVKVEETRDYLQKYKENSKFKSCSLILSDTNKGLANSVIGGVTQVISKYGRAIVVEDDLTVSKNFLSFLNGALEKYEDEMNVGAVSAYSYPLKILKTYKQDTYAILKGDCWGWATWANRWDEASWSVVDFDEYFRDKRLRKGFEKTENGLDVMMFLLSKGKNSSWAVRWVLNLYKKNLLTIYPTRSLVSNEGFDGSGTHSGTEKKYFVPLKEDEEPRSYCEAVHNSQIAKQAALYGRPRLYWLKRIYVFVNVFLNYSKKGKEN